MTLCEKENLSVFHLTCEAAEPHDAHVVPEVDQVQQVKNSTNGPEAVADPPEVGEAVRGLTRNSIIARETAIQRA